MKGSTTGNTSRGSVYSEKPKDISYSVTSGVGVILNYGKGSYLSPLANMPKYVPAVPWGYSKNLLKGQGRTYSKTPKGKKGNYLEMSVSGFSNPFNQGDLKFNVCEICRTPVPKPLRRCVNCSSSFGSY